MKPLRLVRHAPPPRRRRPLNLKPKARRKRGFFSTLRRALIDLALMAGVAGAVMVVGIDKIPPAAQARAEIAAIAPPPVWQADLDGDGIADLANPTQNAVRGRDAYGSGAFHARRDGGKRTHEGADFVVAPGGDVHAPITGAVTRIGYAYVHDTSLRFIELTDSALHLVARVFYVDSDLHVGDVVLAGAVLGVAQNLTAKYPGGITNHVHVEIADDHGFHFDPQQVLPPNGPAPILAALAADKGWAAENPAKVQYASLGAPG